LNFYVNGATGNGEYRWKNTQELKNIRQPKSGKNENGEQ